VGGWVYLEMDSFKTKFFIVIILLGIFSIIFAFVILGNRLEIISYDLIKENLWLAIPLIAIGYLVFEKTQEGLIGSLTNTSLIKRKLSDAEKISSEKYSSVGNFFLSFNGKCYNCKNSVLTHFISDEIKVGDVLKCNDCGSLNNNTYPQKIIYAPGFIVGGLVFFSEWLGDNERKIMFAVIIITVFISFIVSKFWVNTKFFPENESNVK